MTKAVTFPPAEFAPRIEEVEYAFVWTIERYHEAIASGFFTENDRIELLFGQVIPKMSIGVPHREFLKAVRKFFRQFEDRYDSGVQDPVTLVNNSEPEPDFSLITQKRYTRETGHPGPKDVYLLVEVSDDTLRYDRGPKAKAYAQSKIKEYWIVNIKDRQIELHLLPDGEKGEYTLISKHGHGQQFESPVCGLVVVDEVLPDL